MDKKLTGEEAAQGAIDQLDKKKSIIKRMMDIETRSGEKTDITVDRDPSSHRLYFTVFAHEDNEVFREAYDTAPHTPTVSYNMDEETMMFSFNIDLGN